MLRRGAMMEGPAVGRAGLFTSLFLAQVQSAPVQQAGQRQPLHRDRLREVPHLPCESSRAPGPGAGTQPGHLPLEKPRRGLTVSRLLPTPPRHRAQAHPLQRPAV